MGELPVEVFIAMLMIVVVVVVVTAAKSVGGKGDPAWNAAAQRLGLRYECIDTLTGPTISGTQRGLAVQIDTFSKSGDDNRTYTRYRVNFEHPLRLGLTIVQDSPITRVSRRLGKQDIETGDVEFDDILIVKGRDTEKVKAFLTYPRKLRALRFFTTHPGAKIDDSGIEFDERNVARSPDHIVQVVQQMTSLAEHLTREVPGEDYLEAMTAQRESEISSHEIIMPERLEPWPVSLEELVRAEGDTADPPEAAEGEVLSLVEPPDISPGVSEEPTGVAPSDTRKTDLNVNAVIGALFSPGLTSSQTKEYFAHNLEGQSVALAGTLKNVRSYRFDLVFGDTPGTRAEFELAPTDEANSARPPKAVVQFPRDYEERLRAKVDRNIAFSATVKSCDAFMKTLFLVNGQIHEADE